MSIDVQYQIETLDVQYQCFNLVSKHFETMLKKSLITGMGIKCVSFHHLSVNIAYFFIDQEFFYEQIFRNV